MTEYKRNVAVGMTVLLALCGLGYMILRFGEIPAFARPGYRLRIDLPRTGGVIEGADVRLNGKRIGTVARIEFQADLRMGVRLECSIDRRIRIPRDVHVTVGSQGFGGASVQIATGAPAPGQPEPGWLPTDDSAALTGVLPTGGLLGSRIEERLDKIADGFESFRRLADNLNHLLAPAPETGATDAGAGSGLAQTLEKLNKVLDSFHDVTGDQDTRANFKATLADLKTATERGAEAMKELRQFAADARVSLRNVNEGATAVKDVARVASQRIDRLAEKLLEDADKLGRLLSTLNETTGKIADGEGSAAKFINDPHLYNNLLESTRQLARTLGELQSALKTWKTEGVKVNVDLW